MMMRRSGQQAPARLRQKTLQAKPVDSRQRAIALLAKREHAAVELAAKLTRRGLSGQEAEKLVAQLASEGLQSDLRFAESFARSRAGKWGRPRIMRELAFRGVDPETAAKGAASVLGNNSDHDECDRALAILEKRFAKSSADRSGQQRQWRFLRTRGFAADTAAMALRTFAKSAENAGTDEAAADRQHDN